MGTAGAAMVSLLSNTGGGGGGPIRDGGLTSTCVAIRGKGGIMAVDGCVGLRWGALKNYEDVPWLCTSLLIPNGF